MGVSKGRKPPHHMRLRVLPFAGVNMPFAENIERERFYGMEIRRSTILIIETVEAPDYRKKRGASYRTRRFDDGYYKERGD